MKQSFLKLSGKKFLTAVFLSASVLLTSFNSNAAGHSNIEILSGDRSSVLFTGSTDEALLFKVHINNAKGDDFTINIKNENGNLLYSGSFRDIKFLRQFKVLKGEEDGQRYFFNISSANKELEETYIISATTQTTEDVRINKL